MLIFEPDPPFIRWHAIDNKRLSQDKIAFGASCLEKIGRKTILNIGFTWRRFGSRYFEGLSSSNICITAILLARYRYRGVCARK